MCRNSPMCLNGLVKMKLSCDKSVPETSTIPTVERNSVHTRNGLKNYGNTCYLNAFLQLYFRFKRLRQAIYNLSPYADETGITHQLQLIFSQLQLSKSGVVDPGGLIEALRLCNTEQQDAPEFHCLFMNLLETRFHQAGLSVIDDLLRGEYIYETKCLTCGFVSRLPSKFLELSLKVSSKSLLDCISDYLKEEPLTGDNQYACPHCGQKRDGVRKAYITRAPPLLCIQLLRFTYDSRTGQRKKQKGSVSLPDILELTEISETSLSKSIKSDYAVDCLKLGSDPPKHCRFYRLCGILLHIGNQPTSGHYIAVLRDSYKSLENHNIELDSVVNEDNVISSSNFHRIPKECWSVCNDMDVFSIPSHQFNLTKVNGSAKSLQSYLTNACVKLSNDSLNDSITNQTKSVKSSSKFNAKLAKKRRQQDTIHLSSLSQSNEIEYDLSNNSPSSNIWHNSNNAYMIFYESLDNENIKDDEIVPVPDELRQMIEDTNLSNQRKLETDYNTEVNQKKNLRELLNELMPPDFTAASFVESSDNSVSSSSSLSSSLSSTSSSLLNTVSLVPTSWLSDCLNKTDLFIEDKCETGFLNRNNQSLENETSSTANIMNDLCSIHTCIHNQVPVDLGPHTYRAVSTNGFKKLVNLLASDYSVYKHVKFDQFQPCKQCVCLTVALIHLESSIKELSKDIDYFIRTNNLPVINRKKSNSSKSICSVTSDSGPSSYWIGKRSLRQWRALARLYTRALYSDTKHNTSDPTVLHFPTTTFNSDVLCSHGRLCLKTGNSRCLPSILWHRLVTLFPGAKIPTFPVNESSKRDSKVSFDFISTCPDCDVLKINLSKRATCESQLLPGLVLSSARRVSTLQSPQFLATYLRSKTFSNPNKPDIINSSSKECDKELRIIDHLVQQFVLSQFAQIYYNLTQICLMTMFRFFTKSRSHSDSLSQETGINSPYESFSSLKCEDTHCIYLVPMDFIVQWRKFIRNPISDNLPCSLYSGLTAPGVLCKHNQLSKSWQNLVDQSILFPLSSYEWDVLTHTYSQHIKENDELCSTDLQSANNLDLCSQDFPMDSDANSYPTIRLVPTYDQEEFWRLEPANYATLCSQCQLDSLADYFVYHNAKLRVRLVSGFDDAVMTYLQSLPTSSPVTPDNLTDTPEQSENELNSCSSKFERSPNSQFDMAGDQTISLPDKHDQVGATRSKVLTVDAKLVFTPHVRLATAMFELFMEFENLNDIKKFYGKRSLPDKENANINILNSNRCENRFNELTNQELTQLPSNKSRSVVDPAVMNSSNRTSCSQRDRSNCLRRSTRQRLNPNDTLVTVSSNQSLLDLKIHLMQLFGVIPSDQHILYEGVELLDHTKTLEQLQITPKSLLYLWTDDPSWDPKRMSFNNGSNKLLTSVKPKSTSSTLTSTCKTSTTDSVAVELGFRGTRLLEN